jgi:hypothetical protein
MASSVVGSGVSCREQLVAERFGLAHQVLHHPLAVGLFVCGHALRHIVLAVLEETIDEAGQFVGDGGNGRGCSQPRLQAAKERAQGAGTVLETLLPPYFSSPALGVSR